MKAYGEVDVYINIFLTSSLDGGGQLHATVALPQGKHPLDRRLSGLHSRSERRGEMS
jgi:hypothetical protein